MNQYAELPRLYKNGPPFLTRHTDSRANVKEMSTEATQNYSICSLKPPRLYKQVFFFLTRYTHLRANVKEMNTEATRSYSIRSLKKTGHKGGGAEVKSQQEGSANNA